MIGIAIRSKLSYNRMKYMVDRYVRTEGRHGSDAVEYYR